MYAFIYFYIAVSNTCDTMWVVSPSNILYALCIENPNFIDRFIDQTTRKRNQDINQVDNSSKSIDSENFNNNVIRRNEKVIILNLVYHNQTVFA
jgi:ribosomal protein L36